MIRSICLFCLIFISTSGCQKSVPSSERRAVRLNLCTEPVSLDPRKARDLTSSTLIHMVFEGLTRVSKEGAIELALADTVDVSEDSLRYVFHLRDSKWENGDRVTATDFVESWKTILNPQFPSDVAYHLFVLKNGKEVKKGDLPIESLGIEAIDERTVAVELETRVPHFMELISMTPFFPVHQNDPSICNGPFTLKRWKPGDLLSFKKNPTYWEADQVKLNEIECYLATADTGIRMFQEKKLDWTGSPLSTIPSDAIPRLKEQGVLKVKPFLATSFLRVNTTRGPLSSISLRQALACAIDRKEISEHLLQGGHIGATALVPPEMGLSKQGYFPDGDRSMALSLSQGALREINLGSMEEMEPIVLSFMAGDRNGALAQTIQQEWERTLGIRVLLDAVEPKVYFQKVSKKEFQLALGSWTADYNDPINFLEIFKYRESGTNNTGWENQRFIDLLTQSSVCKEAEERIRCLSAAEKILMDQMPIIPIYHFVLNFLVQDGLKGVAISPIGGIDFRWAYWEK